jgi:L-asparaginase
MVPFIDFRYNPGNQENPVRFFSDLFFAIADELSLDFTKLNIWIKDNLKGDYTNSWVKFFVEFVRKQSKLKKPILLIFDEIDYLQLSCRETDQFFNGLQVLFDYQRNQRNQLEISMLLIGINHPKELLKDAKKSSFKSGQTIVFPDFSSDEETISKWSEGLNVKDSRKLDIGKSIFYYTGGQPYLNSLIYHNFNEAKGSSASDVKSIVNKLILDSKNPRTKNPHFDAPQDFIFDKEDIAYKVIDFYSAFLRKNEPVPISDIDEKTFAVLQTAGLITCYDNETFDIRCPIYRKVFDENWCKKIQSSLGSKEFFHVQVRNVYRNQDSNRPKICMFNSGGTIGMVEINGKMTPPHSQKEFLDLYPEIERIADIDFIQIEAIDGANVFPEYWSKIARAIYDRRNEEYNGFVIAHGTDTMVYTASAVAFALGPGLNKPVVFVGSQAPHYVMHGDALINLFRAVKIASEKIPEVVICFNDLVFRAVRAEKKDDYRFSGFHSPTFKPLAIITEQIEIQKELLIHKDPLYKIVCKDQFDTNILKISQYPGLHPEIYYPYIDNKSVSAIIIETLGLGNLPTTGVYNFLPLIENAKNNLIPVVITSRYPILPEFMNKYLPVSAPIQKGAISAGNMTSAAALTKLMWLLPQIEKDIQQGEIKEHNKMIEIQQLIKHNFIGEVDKMPELDNLTI